MKKRTARSIALMLLMTIAVSACSGGTPNPGTSTSEAASTASSSSGEEVSQVTIERDDTPAAEAFADFDASEWDAISSTLYNANLGEFYEAYQASKETDNISERYALMAVAEAKLLEAAMMIPLTTRGGNYAISRIAPRTSNTTLWGNDDERRHNVVIATDYIKPEDRDHLVEYWNENRGDGTYEQYVRDYLTEQGYELDDVYDYGYTSDPNTWDVLNTSRAADSEKIIHTYDGLMEYDMENVQQPALAESYEVSDDGMTYTFHIRQGVNWVDSQGRTVAPVQADDFVAGMQHMMDAMGGLEYLVGADGCQIVGADAYINGETDDFETVGVKALDDYTLEYTLDYNCPFFLSMLSYGVFAPMSRTYYESQGGKFGTEFDAEAEDYLYGTDPDHIAYCGPYLVTNFTPENTIVYKANPAYWNAANVTISGINLYFNDGTDATKAYTDMTAGTTDGCGLNTAGVEAAKADGLFDDYSYVSTTDATSYMGFFNINRQAYSNFNDGTTAQSTKTVYDAQRTAAAMQNVHFRRALLTALDRGSYNAQSVGEELKLNNLRNSYVPGNFVSIDEDVTIDINGTATSFAAGTFYGEIMQAQIDADGLGVKVWDDVNLTGDGFDGWYNPSKSEEELATALEELAEAGVEVTTDDPIIIEVPFFAGSEVYTNRANVFKQSFENVLGGYVTVELIPCESADDWYYAGYYPDYGYEMNADIMDVSGWGPDYGDPQTYLDTMLPDYAGYMVKSMGLF